MNSKIATRIALASLSVLMLTVAAQTAKADNVVDFYCTPATCSSLPGTGTVTQSGPNYSTTGITVMNDSGPDSGSSTPFDLAFNTATGTISITGTGALSGETLVGTIMSGWSGSGNTTTDLSFAANWGTLPADFAAFLGTPTGTDTGSVIYLTSTGSAESVDVLITPTPAPEPASLLLLGAGLLVLAGMSRRKVADLV
jgi:PEP-CTERM motif